MMSKKIFSAAFNQLCIFLGIFLLVRSPKLSAFTVSPNTSLLEKKYYRKRICQLIKIPGSHKQRPQNLLKMLKFCQKVHCSWYHTRNHFFFSQNKGAFTNYVNRIWHNFYTLPPPCERTWTFWWPPLRTTWTFDDPPPLLHSP